MDAPAQVVTGPLKLPRVESIRIDPARLWRWCPQLGDRTMQPIERVEDGIEYCRCDACGQLHEYPVKGKR
jgi:hypothetical protein